VRVLRDQIKYSTAMRYRDRQFGFQRQDQLEKVTVADFGSGLVKCCCEVRGLGLAACQKGPSVGFTTAAALVHETDRDQGREATAPPATPARRPQAPDH